MGRKNLKGWKPRRPSKSQAEVENGGKMVEFGGWEVEDGGRGSGSGARGVAKAEAG